MKFSYLLQILTLSSTALAAARFGVGFSLSLDYGTATIYFANGTTVDVAKVEGSPKYKTLMRELRPIPIIFESAAAAAAKGPVYPGSQARMQVQSTMKTIVKNGAALKRTIPGVGLSSRKSALRKRWGGARADTLAYMLESLRGPVQAYLEGLISTADITLPFVVSEEQYEDIVAACDSLVIRRTLRHQYPPASIMAVKAADLPKKCSTRALAGTAKRNILAVDYSRAALTMTMIIAEGGEGRDCPRYKEKSISHTLELGTAALKSCSERYGERRCREKLSDKIYDFVLSSSLRLSQIDSVVSFGEASTDGRLVSVLKEHFGDIASRKSSSGMDAESTALDATFAASRGIAVESWRNCKA